MRSHAEHGNEGKLESMPIMNICCTKCFTIIRFEGLISPTGSTIECSGCGSAFTIYPSKIVIGDFAEYVVDNSDISVRACSMFWRNIPDVDVFLRSSKKDFFGFRNCGLKTANELIRLQSELRKKLGYGSEPIESEDKTGETNRKAVIEFLSGDRFFKELLESNLSEARFKPLRRLGFDTLEKLLALSYENALQIKYVGRNTIYLIRDLQENYTEIINTIANSEDLRFKDFKRVVRSNQMIRDILSCGKNIDADTPFPSISRWILENSRHSERNRDVFMCRMGMLGEPKMTYEEIGVRHNISRERVRQILEKVKTNGRRPLQRIRLDPLIARAADIAKSSEGRTGISGLAEPLLARGPQGALLQNAEAFIEYLRSFPEWWEVMEREGANVFGGAEQRGMASNNSII